MATTTLPSKQSSDMPWIIGSALVFLPTIAWILSSGKGGDHAHHPAPNEHIKVAEAIKEASKEHAPEPVVPEPTPEPVAEEKPDESTPETRTPESVVSDDEGVVISKEEVEESINKAVDADVPKEAKVVEVTEATPSEPSPTPSESEPAKESEASTPQKEETPESTPAPTPEGASTEKKETQGH